MKLTDDDWKRLEEYRDRVVDAVCTRHGCSSEQLFATKMKRGRRGTLHACGVSAARRDAVRILRSTVMYFRKSIDICPGGTLTIFNLSYPDIGRLLKISHSTAVLIVMKFTSSGVDWYLPLDIYLQQSADALKITPAGEVGCEKGVSKSEEKRALREP